MNTILILALLLWLYMNVFFGIACLKKRNDIADVAWGLGFVFLAWISFFLYQNFDARAILVNILVTAWGLRLAYHIYMRMRKKPEDYRYAAWRAAWKNFYLRSYLKIFMLQGFLLFIIAQTIFAIHRNPAPLEFLDFIAFILWLIGFALESLADRQLADFMKKAENKGKIIQEGLWKYSRHPNYFGEIIQWWGIFLLAFSTIENTWTIISPVILTFLIVKVSGVPMLEKKYENNEKISLFLRRLFIYF